jgi:cardiolipin synthase
VKVLKIRQKIINKIFKRVFQPKKIKNIHGPLFKKVIFNWKNALNKLLLLGGLSDGNKILLITDGDEQFYLMRKSILEAKKSIWFEIYLYEPDKIGKYILDAMVKAAQRGCEVILLYDHFGSGKLSNSFLEPLLKAGATALPFNPIWPWKKKGPFLTRDHRKILIIDNKIAFCGGVNISQDYAGKMLGNGRFRDTLAKIKGPCVYELSQFFWGSFSETTGEDRYNAKFIPKINKGEFIQVLGSNTRKNIRSIQSSMEVTLCQATKYCYLTSPYFLPYKQLQKAMIAAAKRGVDIRILCAGLSDIPLMRNASQHIYSKFIKYGIRVFEMFEKNLHAKTATIDGVYSTIGSYNLDRWSDKRNLEINLSILDCKLATELEIHFFKDLKLSKEVTLQSLKAQSAIKRFINWCSYMIMKL